MEANLVTNAVDLRGTRTSRSWDTRPGNWDRLNLKMIFQGDDQLGIPGWAARLVLPTTMINYNARNRLGKPEPGDCVHFFLDDYRFETMWTQPQRALRRVVRVGMSLTPDFSLYPEMPLIVQMWNVYRSRWCGAWMAHHGIEVIPTVSWSDERSYSFAFTGLDGGTVAVSTVGIVRASRHEQGRFLGGYRAMLDAVRPERVLIYGKHMALLDQINQVEQVYYCPRRWS